jgi:YihY family inner membrane protein
MASARNRSRRSDGLVRGSIHRFIEADGPSHSRSFAFQSMFVLLSGFIGLMGLAGVLGIDVLRSTIEELLLGLSPGPAGAVLEEAVRRGFGVIGALLGLGAAITSGTLAMAQFQRSANRLLGNEEDRPTVRRYVVGLLLALSSGVLLASGALILAGGEALVAGAGAEVGSLWEVVRWPLGVVVAGLAILLLYWVAPQGRPGSRGSMLVGSAVAIVLWIGFTGLLSLYFSMSDQVARTYGPLVGIVALLLWCGLSSLALHVGFAVTAELGGGTVGTRTVTIPEPAGARRSAG